jgi:hypothetical protein
LTVAAKASVTEQPKSAKVTKAARVIHMMMMMMMMSRRPRRRILLVDYCET